MANIIAGCGSYLPKRVITNSEMVQILDGTTTEEWIFSRTGITQRHVVAEGEYTSHMAAHASLRAIEDAGIDKSDIDLVILCTTTPDSTFPSSSAKLQANLGLLGIPSFDIQAVCSGFVYGIHIADCMMSAAGYKTALIVGAETMSSILDWKDRSTSILFGDGAGAVILKKSTSESGIIGSIIHSDGTLGDILYTNGGTASTGRSGVVHMNGREVFRHATQKLCDISLEILTKYGIKANNIDYFVPHQANVRIIDHVAEKLGIEESKIIKTVDKHANCSAASVPLALSDLKKSGRLKKGDIILTAAIGAGITWGANLLRW
ncbi:MAG: ketoacyl-ACP synthase III [Rickettsiaceae bacterium]|nr:ketoacyl-ACP synthase III [Rickettsiaceae bacterium]